MPGYWVIRGSAIRDQQALESYGKAWQPIAERFGARILVGGGRHETREGADFPRVLVIEFPSYEQALACYDDAEYQAILPVAMRAYDRELLIIEGR